MKLNRSTLSGHSSMKLDHDRRDACRGGLLFVYPSHSIQSIHPSGQLMYLNESARHGWRHSVASRISGITACLVLNLQCASRDDGSFAPSLVLWLTEKRVSWQTNNSRTVWWRQVVFFSSFIVLSSEEATPRLDGVCFRNILPQSFNAADIQSTRKVGHFGGSWAGNNVLTRPSLCDSFQTCGPAGRSGGPTMGFPVSLSAVHGRQIITATNI